MIFNDMEKHRPNDNLILLQAQASEFSWVPNAMDTQCPWIHLEMSKLCEICRSIFQGHLGRANLGFKGFDLGQTVSELRTSAERGCHLRFQRWEQLLPQQRISLTDRGNYKLLLLWRACGRACVCLSKSRAESVPDTERVSFNPQSRVMGYRTLLASQLPFIALVLLANIPSIRKETSYSVDRSWL